MKSALQTIGLILWVIINFIAVVCVSVGIPVFIVFLVLKLTNVIHWAWVLVCTPLIAWGISLAYVIINRVIIAMKEEGIL